MTTFLIIYLNEPFWNMNQIQSRKQYNIFDQVMALTNQFGNANFKSDKLANYNFDYVKPKLGDLSHDIIKNNDDNSSDFIHSIIHELKTPLNAISGFADILQCDINKAGSKEQCIDYINEIKNAAEDLNELIHDLLDVNNSNQLTNGFEIDLSQEIAIDNIIKRAIKLNSNYALRRKITLKNQISHNCPKIRLDAKRMKQILNNLISNAIKYSDEHTNVIISSKVITKNNNSDQKYLEISVRDHGFGMTKSQIRDAFEKYKIIENPNSKKVDSLGLGLPITKQLVEAQRGQLTVKSELNKGTKVILTFPYTTKLGIATV